LDNTPAQYLSRLPVRDTQIINFLSQVFPNPFNGTNPIYGSTTSRGNLLRPFPQFSGVAMKEPVGFNRNSAQQSASNIRVSPVLFGGIRAECLNAWNHPNLFAPNTTVTSSAFGTITNQDVPRAWQMSLKLKF